VLASRLFSFLRYLMIFWLSFTVFLPMCYTLPAKQAI
jgi:hypothetical protein